MQIIIIAFLLYFLYRFVFGFLIPVAKTAGHVKQQFNAMKNQMDGNQEKQPHTSSFQSDSFGGTNTFKNRSTSGKKGSKEDYIEFEEVPKSRD